MPAKKKGKKKAKGGGKEDQDKDDIENKSEPNMKEQELRKELDSLTEKLSSLKQEVEELRQGNEWLQEEAQQTRLESHEYMSYMAKKTQKRQTTIVSLSDRNQKELHDIGEQKEKIKKEFEQKKQALKQILLEKEAELAIANSDVEDLDEYRRLQLDQEAEICRLNQEVHNMRGKHSEAIQKLKSQFLREKRNYQKDSDVRIRDMAQQASQEAKQCLDEHTHRIKSENRVLRKELLQLIRQTRALHAHRQELEEQHKTLQRELQYGRDLRRLRGSRQNRLYKSFGIEDDSEEKAAEKKTVAFMAAK